MLVYKHSEIIEYVKNRLLFKKFTNFTLNNTRILRIKNAASSVQCFLYEHKHIRSFQIWIGVSLRD